MHIFAGLISKNWEHLSIGKLRDYQRQAGKLGLKQRRDIFQKLYCSEAEVKEQSSADIDDYTKVVNVVDNADIDASHIEDSNRVDESYEGKLSEIDDVHDDLYEGQEGEYSDGEYEQSDSGSEGLYVDEENRQRHRPLFDYIMVDFEILLETLIFCRECKSKSVSFEPKCNVGAGVTLRISCNECRNSWSWTSTQRTPNGILVNTDISTASVVCGLSYSALHQFFQCLGMPHLAEQSHHNVVNKKIEPVVKEVFDSVQKEVIDTVVKGAASSGKIDIAGDAMYDSPGFNARYCRYALVEVKTGLVVDVEARRKERTESSKAQEPKALETSLTRFVKRVEEYQQDICVASITTDRDASVRKLLEEKFSKITRWTDCWHFVKNVYNTLLKKKDQVRMRPVQHWIKALTNHLYYSIISSDGDGQLAKEKFLSFFYHIQGIHEDFSNIESFQFQKFRKCDHGILKENGNYLDLNNEEHKLAYDVLYSITVTEQRMKDIECVSPHLATSEVEAYNSLSILYHPKSRFFGLKGFDMRMRLSAIHWNTLKLETLQGVRQKNRRKSFYSKKHKKIVWKSVFDKGTQAWRKDIFDEVRRRSYEEQPREVLDDEEIDLELEELALDANGFELESIEEDDNFSTDSEQDDDDIERKLEKEGPFAKLNSLQDEGNWKDLVLPISERLKPKSIRKQVDYNQFNFGNPRQKVFRQMFHSNVFKTDYFGTGISDSDEDEEKEGTDDEEKR